MGDSIENFFGDCSMSSTAFMGIGFLKAPARVDCLARPDTRVGCCFCFNTIWCFLLVYPFGDGAIFSDVVDPESFDDKDVALSFRLVFDWNSIPLVGVLGAGRPPFLSPVAFRLDGLFCCSLRVSFTGYPDASSLNLGVVVHLGSLYLKNVNKVLFSGRIYMPHNH